MCSIRLFGSARVAVGVEGAQGAAPAGSLKGGKGGVVLTKSEMTTSWTTLECIVRVCAPWPVLSGRRALAGRACGWLRGSVLVWGAGGRVVGSAGARVEC